MKFYGKAEGVASKIIEQLVQSIGDAGEDVEVQFALDVEKWHPPLVLHLFEFSDERPGKYGVTLRFTTGGQHTRQTLESYQFMEVAARAWTTHKRAKPSR